MIAELSKQALQSPAIVMDVGNSSVHVATWVNNELKTTVTVPSDDTSAIDEAFTTHAEACPNGKPAATIIASVVPDALTQICDYVQETTGRRALVIGKSVPVSLEMTVADKQSVGIDRLCAAVAAFDSFGSACTVIDFGTAVTVDLVDDDGVFLGGSILPGLKLQFRALHEHTAALPLVEPELPKEPVGKDTAEAIQNGVCRGMVGAVRGIVEGYATILNRWPHVVATGGDLPLLLSSCDFVDQAVTHLALRGVGLNYSHFLASQGV